MDKKQICQFYLTGNCKFGKNCRKSHYINVNMKANNSRDCKYFLKGNCNKGENCPFFHRYCGRLQYFKTVNNQKNLVNELISTDNKSYISVDNKQFFLRKLENQNENNGALDEICEGYKISKAIFSGNKFICCVEKDSV